MPITPILKHDREDETMKKTGVAIMAVMFSMAAVASEKEADKTVMCQPLVTIPMEQTSTAPSVSPTFYVTSQADYKACKEMARKQGGRVIINPDA